MYVLSLSLSVATYKRLHIFMLLPINVVTYLTRDSHHFFVFANGVRFCLTELCSLSQIKTVTKWLHKFSVNTEHDIYITYWLYFSYISYSMIINLIYWYKQNHNIQIHNINILPWWFPILKVCEYQIPTMIIKFILNIFIWY